MAFLKTHDFLSSADALRRASAQASAYTESGPYIVLDLRMIAEVRGAFASIRFGNPGYGLDRDSAGVSWGGNHATEALHGANPLTAL